MRVRHTTGVLHLNNAQSPNRSNTCLSSYDSKNPNYALSNFAHLDGYSPYKTAKGQPAFQFIDPDVGKVNFPTSEHYLHFQQLSPTAKNEMLQKGWADAPTSEILIGKTTKGSKWEISVRMLHDSLKTDGQYDDEKWTNKAIDVQMQINAVKYQQSLEFKACIDEAIELGKYFGDGLGAATIIEDTASLSFGKKPETKWGTGPKGDGLNLLGISLTAFANMVMKKSKDARLEFDLASANYMAPGSVRDSLIEIRCNFPNALAQPDTSKLGANLVCNFSDTYSLKAASTNKIFNAPAAKSLPTSQPNLNINFDNNRNHYVVYNPQRRDLQVQYDIRGNFKRAMFYDNKTSTWKESGAPDSFKWVRELKEQYKQHLKQQQASQNNNNNTGRAPDPKKIPIPYCIGKDIFGNNTNFSIQNVAAVYIDKGPQHEALKITFESKADFDTAKDSFKEAGITIRIDPPSRKTGGLPALSFLGDIQTLAKVAQKINDRDTEKYGFQKRI